MRGETMGRHYKPTPDHVPQQGDAVSVLALGLFECDRCGALCQKITMARVGDDGTVREAERPPGEVVCNGCTAKEQTAIRRANRQAANRKAWASKARVKVKG
jgi:hypothetical protein